MSQTQFLAPIPLRWVGPLHIHFQKTGLQQIHVPLATFEIPLWPSVTRGARATASYGIKTVQISACMTRSVVLRGPSAIVLHEIAREIDESFAELQAVVETTSNYCRLKSWYYELHGTRLYARFSFETGQASGHNMSTKASQALIDYLLSRYTQLAYGSISANVCTDKKTSAINAYLGRGRHVIAESIIPRLICQKILKTIPEKIVELHIDKNYLGSIVAGSLRSANAHYANMLLALYLALGQDAANIVEGSQGITFAQVSPEGDLYFSVSLPHLIVGSHGNGKDLEWVRANLEKISCTADFDDDPSHRLAEVMAATVLCGELSLLAAQSCEGVLVESHMRLERQKKVLS